MLGKGDFTRMAHNIEIKDIFLVLRDRYGIVQVVFDEDCSEDLMTTGRSIALEYTVRYRDCSSSWRWCQECKNNDR